MTDDVNDSDQTDDLPLDTPEPDARPARGPYQLLPPLPPEVLAQLEASLRAHGVEDAITVDEDGQTLDGHHRRLLADRLGIPYQTTVVTGLSEDEKRLYAIRRNTERRQLTRAQQTLVGLRAEPSFRAQAKSRQGQRSDLSPDLAKRRRVWAAEEAARLVGLSLSTYKVYRSWLIEARQRHGTAAVEAKIETGDWDVGELHALHGQELARRREPSPEEIAAQQQRDEEKRQRAAKAAEEEAERLRDHWQQGGAHRWSGALRDQAAADDEDFWECGFCGAYSSPTHTACTGCGAARGSRPAVPSLPPPVASPSPPPPTGFPDPVPNPVTAPWRAVGPPAPTLADVDWLKEGRWAGPERRGDPRQIAAVVLARWSVDDVADLRERLVLLRAWLASFDAALSDGRAGLSLTDDAVT